MIWINRRSFFFRLPRFVFINYLLWLVKLFILPETEGMRITKLWSHFQGGMRCCTLVAEYVGYSYSCSSNIASFALLIDTVSAQDQC